MSSTASVTPGRLWGRRASAGALAVGTAVVVGLAPTGSEGAENAGSAAGSPAVFFLAGGGVGPASPRDGLVATEARVDAKDVSARSDGTIFVVDSTDRVEAIDPAGRLRLVAGTGRFGSTVDGGSATRASLAGASAVAVTPDGGVLVSEQYGHRIRLVRADGIITTVAGTGKAGSTGDGGPAIAARLQSPADVVALDDGSFLIADEGANRVRRVDADGGISTLVGTGRPASRGDGGPGRAAAIDGPVALALMADRSLLVAEGEGGRVRRVAPDGTIATVAGGGRGSRALADGQPAVRTRLLGPSGVLGLPDGSFLFDDVDIWRVTPDGAMHRVLSSRSFDFAGRGLYQYGLTRSGQLTATSDGDVLLAAGPLRVIAPVGPLRLVTSLTGAVAGVRSLTASFVVTVAGVATLAVLRRGRLIAQTGEQAVGRGAASLRLIHPFAPGRYAVRVRVQTADGRVASDSVTAYLGARLVRRDVRARLAAELPEGDEGGDWVVGRCRSFGPRRTDCEIRDVGYPLAPPGPTVASDVCSVVDSVSLPPNGILEVAQYRCARSRTPSSVRKRPHLFARPRPFPEADLAF
jgi:hypothetical protein